MTNEKIFPDVEFTPVGLAVGLAVGLGVVGFGVGPSQDAEFIKYR